MKIHCFGTGSGITKEELDRAEKERLMEELDDVLKILDPFYCDED